MNRSVRMICPTWQVGQNVYIYGDNVTLLTAIESLTTVMVN